MLIKHEWGEGRTHSGVIILGGVGPLVGGVQIIFSLCSVLYCLPARRRGCGCRGADPGEGRVDRMPAGGSRHPEGCHVAPAR